MLTTPSMTRSATSGIEPSVSVAGDACAGAVPERSAAPVPTSPTTAAAAMSVLSGVIGSSLSYESLTALQVASIPQPRPPDRAGGHAPHAQSLTAGESA